MRGAERRAQAEANSHARDAERLLEEAVGWFVRLGAEQCSEAERREFERWLAQSEAHRAAYARTESLWRQLDGLHEVVGPGLAVPAGQTNRLVPAFLAALRNAAQRRGTNSKLHVVAGQDHGVPAEWFEPVAITRAEGPIVEPGTEILSLDDLGIEWEWEKSPEVTLAIVGSVEEAIDLFNATSPQFAASLVSADPAEHQRFYDRINAPFVGNGFTRWVDGQYALDRPELGLSNWQCGRLLGRGGVLSGDSVFTLRTVAHQTDPDLAR